MTRLAPVALLAATFSLAVACGGGDDPDTSAKPGSPLDAPMTKGAKGFCALLSQCSPTFAEIYFGSDEARCAERERSTVLDGLAQPGILVTPATLDACADEGIAGGCAELFKLLGGNDDPPSCKVPGKLVDGAACAYPLQCASGNCARGTTPTTCGVCAPRSAAGGACGQDTDCAYGHACAEKVCVPFGTTDATCDAKHPCLPTLRCDGTCKAPLGEGDACKNVTGDCDLYVKGLACVGGTCQKVTFANEGEDCGVTSGRPVACSSGSCKPSLLKGTCFKNAKDGEPCDSFLGADCELHASCVDGKCVPLFSQKCE